MLSSIRPNSHNEMTSPDILLQQLSLTSFAIWTRRLSAHRSTRRAGHSVHQTRTHVLWPNKNAVPGSTRHPVRNRMPRERLSTLSKEHEQVATQVAKPVESWLLQWTIRDGQARKLLKDRSRRKQWTAHARTHNPSVVGSNPTGPTTLSIAYPLDHCCGRPVDRHLGSHRDQNFIHPGGRGGQPDDPTYRLRFQQPQAIQDMIGR